MSNLIGALPVYYLSVLQASHGAIFIVGFIMYNSFIVGFIIIIHRFRT